MDQIPWPSIIILLLINLKKYYNMQS